MEKKLKIWVCGFWWMTSRLGYVLLLFGFSFMTSSLNQCADLVAQSLFGF